MKLRMIKWIGSPQPTTSNRQWKTQDSFQLLGQCHWTQTAEWIWMHLLGRPNRLRKKKSLSYLSIHKINWEGGSLEPPDQVGRLAGPAQPRVLVLTPTPPDAASHKLFAPQLSTSALYPTIIMCPRCPRLITNPSLDFANTSFSKNKNLNCP